VHVQGKVKWFSEEKGYGYIVGDDGKDYYFNVRAVQGADLPRNGDVVMFEGGQGNKGPRATSVLITAKSPSRNQSIGNYRADDRATCTHCAKKMVPRINTHRGNPQRSVCPFCGGTFKKFGGCFIASAVYGDYYAPEVIALRRFRDETLEPSVFGRAFIALYYRVSPPIAAILTRRPMLSALVRLFLNVLARRNG
jgi:cold shock CspA family protein